MSRDGDPNGLSPGRLRALFNAIADTRPGLDRAARRAPGPADVDAQHASPGPHDRIGHEFAIPRTSPASFKSIAMLSGSACMENRGGPIVTTASARAVLEPLVQARPNVFRAWVSGTATDSLPFAALLPDQAPSAVQLVACRVVQVSVTRCPSATVVASEVKVTLGIGWGSSAQPSKAVATAPPSTVARSPLLRRMAPLPALPCSTRSVRFPNVGLRPDVPPCPGVAPVPPASAGLGLSCAECNTPRMAKRNTQCHSIGISSGSSSTPFVRPHGVDAGHQVGP